MDKFTGSQSDYERIMILARAVKQLERKIDFILNEMNLVYDDFGEEDDLIDMDDIRAALLNGNKIEAIKLYRMQTGAGLRDAKAMIDQMYKNL
jgi:ribosomal protein L7/L12